MKWNTLNVCFEYKKSLIWTKWEQKSGLKDLILLLNYISQSFLTKTCYLGIKGSFSTTYGTNHFEKMFQNSQRYWPILEKIIGTVIGIGRYEKFKYWWLSVSADMEKTWSFAHYVVYQVDCLEWWFCTKCREAST